MPGDSAFLIGGTAFHASGAERLKTSFLAGWFALYSDSQPAGTRVEGSGRVKEEAWAMGLGGFG